MIGCNVTFIVTIILLFVKILLILLQILEYLPGRRSDYECGIRFVIIYPLFTEMIGQFLISEENPRLSEISLYSEFLALLPIQKLAFLENQHEFAVLLNLIEWNLQKTLLDLGVARNFHLDKVLRLVAVNCRGVRIKNVVNQRSG